MRKTTNSNFKEALKFIIRQKIINNLNACYNGTNNFYIGDNIPEFKIGNAVCAYGLNNQKYLLEYQGSYDVCALYDNTVFGGAKEGFMITTLGIMAYNISDKEKIYVAWDSINEVKTSNTEIIIVHINKKKTIIVCDEKPVRELIEKLLILIKNEIIGDYKKFNYFIKPSNNQRYEKNRKINVMPLPKILKQL